MDESPLVKAHDHARAASNATHQSDTTVAINEHALAAGEFANAARSISSLEALRTLKLLEEHHKHLSELLKIPLDRRTSQTSNPDAIDEKSESQSPESTNVSASDHVRAKTETAGASPVTTAKVVPSLTQQRRYPSREMTSSIASNLASARGIRSGRNRSQPIPPSVTNDQAPGNVEIQARREGSRAKMQNVLDHSGKPAWIPPTHVEQQRKDDTKRAEEATSPASDDGYSRFYNAFGGWINRISAPLAFAGLPLIAEESTVAEPVEASESALSKRSKLKSPAAPAEPDLSKIYSRATLRSISAHNPNDSFYVVPTSGHTVSYANILNFADKEKRRLEASLHSSSLIEDDEDDFVDARETPSAPLSPGAKRRVGKTRTERDLSNTVEELCTENKGLKDMLDKLSKRLHAFEASAQSSSLALAESMRFRRPGSPTSNSGNMGGDAVLRSRNKDLEEQLALAIQRMEALEKENRTMARTLEKYRDKWDKLKAGAKARRQAQGSAEAAPDAEETAGGS